MPIAFIIANVLAFTGNSLFTVSSFFKSRTKALLLQSVNHGLCIVSELLTFAYSGMVQESVSLLRNIMLLFLKTNNKIVKTVVYFTFMVIAVTVGILLNIFLSDNVWYGYLPIFGTGVYTLGLILAFLINTTEVNKQLITKISLMINCVLWCKYGFYISLYSAVFFNLLNLVILIVSVIKILVSINKAKNDSDSVEAFSH